MDIFPRVLLTLSLAAVFTLPVSAEHRTGPEPFRLGGGPVRVDQRYGHDHYYPAPGFKVRNLPARSLSVPHGNATWFYHGGVWFRHEGAAFVVDVPPLGVVVPFLPPAYVPLQIGGAPYYYANGVYYENASEGYVVVAPPANAELAQAAAPTFFIYPRNGQPAGQADANRAACNEWAAAQPAVAEDPWAFQRAFAACMDGRGYTVR